MHGLTARVRAGARASLRGRGGEWRSLIAWRDRDEEQLAAAGIARRGRYGGERSGAGA